jgi:hypothetical protein
MRKLVFVVASTAMLFALGLGSAFAQGGNSGGSPQCPVQSPQGSMAQQAGNTVGPPCGFAVGLLGVCPPHSHNAGNSGPPCGKSTTTTSSAPAPCGFSNPPTSGPISAALGQIGEAIGDNPLGDAVVQIACAVSSLTGGAL